MYPGLPSRLEKEMKQLYLTGVLGGDPTRLNVSLYPNTNYLFLIGLDLVFRNLRSGSRILHAASTWCSLEVQSSLIS
jgi:hypothetical protein